MPLFQGIFSFPRLSLRTGSIALKHHAGSWPDLLSMQNMEEVDVERLKAYAAGKLSARERDIFEQYCRSLGYNPQVLVEILEFEQNQPRATSPYDANAAFEKFKSKLNK